MALRDQFIRCRRGIMGHAWDTVPYVGPKPQYGVIVVYRCMRCTTERHDKYNITGKRLGRRYIYPEGYSWKGHRDDRPTSDQLREMFLRQLRRHKHSPATNVVSIRKDAS